MIEYLIAFAAGAFCKLVDDIEDTENHILKDIKEYIQSLCTAFTSIWLYNDVLISLLHIMIILPACFYVNEVDTVYWKTLLPLPFITFLCNAHSLGNIDMYEFFQIAVVYIVTFVSIIIESYTFPEETSTIKTISRIIIFISLIIAVLFLRETNKNVRFVKFAKSFFIYAIGYILVSILSKLFPCRQPEAIDELIK